MTNKQKGILCILISAFSFALMNLFCAAGRRYQSDSEKLFPKSHRFYLCRRYFIERTRFFISETQFKISFSPLGSGNGRYFVQLLCPWPYAPVGCFHARQAVSLCRSYLFLHFLKEKINGFQVFSIVIAFIGSLFIIRPGFSLTEMFPALMGLAGAIAAGGAYTTVRYLGLRGERGPFIVFFSRPFPVWPYFPTFS